MISYAPSCNSRQIQRNDVNLRLFKNEGSNCREGGNFIANDFKHCAGVAVNVWPFAAIHFWPGVPRFYGDGMLPYFVLLCFVSWFVWII